MNNELKIREISEFWHNRVSDNPVGTVLEDWISYYHIGDQSRKDLFRLACELNCEEIYQMSSMDESYDLATKFMSIYLPFVFALLKQHDYQRYCMAHDRFVNSINDFYIRNRLQSSNVEIKISFLREVLKPLENKNIEKEYQKQIKALKETFPDMVHDETKVRNNLLDLRLNIAKRIIKENSLDADIDSNLMLMQEVLKNHEIYS